MNSTLPSVQELDEKSSSELSARSAVKPSPVPACGVDGGCPREKSSKPFDPYDFGNDDGLGVFAACVHLVRCTIGSGILMMPYLMRNLGCVTGTALMTSAALVYYHNVHILVATEYRLCQLLHAKRLPFAGVVEAAFGRAPYPINKCGAAVSFVSNFYFSLPTSPATYLIVLSTNVRYMALYFGVRLDTRTVITLLAVPLTVFCLVRKILRILVPFSSTANALTFVMAGVVIGCSFACRNAAAAPKLFGDLNFVPRGLAMFILAIRCTGIILPVKSDMRRPRRFAASFGSLNLSAFAVIFVYNTFALTVYVNYGDQVPENILAHMPEGSLVSFLTYLFYSLALSVTYVLVTFVCLESLWMSKLEPGLKPGVFKTVCEYGIKVGINLAAYFLAVYVPQISLIAAMAGTLGILVEIALPPFLQVLLLSAEKRCTCLIMIKNFSLIFMSAALFCMSLARCVRELTELFSQ